MAARSLADQLKADQRPEGTESPIIVTARKVAEARAALDSIAATCDRAHEAMRELEMQRKEAQRRYQVSVQEHESALAFRG